MSLAGWPHEVSKSEQPGEGRDYSVGRRCLCSLKQNHSLTVSLFVFASCAGEQQFTALHPKAYLRGIPGRSREKWEIIARIKRTFWLMDVIRYNF